MTRSTGHYETGAFDLRSPHVRETGLADCARRLLQGRELSHPVLKASGWWRKPTSDEGAPPLLIAGTGVVGRALENICGARGLACVPLPRSQLDIADPTSVDEALERYQPWAVINAAGYTHIDRAEDECHLCRRENTIGPITLAAACERLDIALVTFSTSLVFDGALSRPYQESDCVGPLNQYAQSKVDAEVHVQRIMPKALVIRSGDLFGPWDRSNFVWSVLDSLANQRVVYAADDLIVSPSYLPDVVHACLDLLIDGEHGVWHLANTGEVTWAEFAREAARRDNRDTSGIVSAPSVSMLLRARRPPYSALGTEHGQALPGLDNALDRFFDEHADVPVAACVV